jgi:hypothetical protein
MELSIWSWPAIQRSPYARQLSKLQAQTSVYSKITIGDLNGFLACMYITTEWQWMSARLTIGGL